MTKSFPPTISLFGDGHLSSYLKPLLLKNNVIFNTFGRSSHHNISFDLDNLKSLECLKKASDVIIYMIPPHKNTIDALTVLAKKKRKIIFISSTSVYGDGKSNEETQTFPKTKNAKLLIEAESFIANNFYSYQLIRPGGLVDSKRSPKKFIKSTTVIKDGLSMINFIHTQDLARFIIFLMSNSISHRVINLNTGENLTKKNFYHQLFPENENRPIIKDVFERCVSSLYLNGLSFYLKYPNIIETIK